jgi:hypothetical protein
MTNSSAITAEKGVQWYGQVGLLMRIILYFSSVLDVEDKQIKLQTRAFHSMGCWVKIEGTFVRIWGVFYGKHSIK